MDEKIIVGITVANFQKDVVSLFAVGKLDPSPELSHDLSKCRASATTIRANGDLVLCDGRSNA